MKYGNLRHYKLLWKVCQLCSSSHKINYKLRRIANLSVKLELPALLGNFDRPTNQPTNDATMDRPGHKEVTGVGAGATQAAGCCGQRHPHGQPPARAGPEVGRGRLSW